MSDIGIVGGGVAGLQLGLDLQQRGIPATLYAERTPDELRARRLSNMVARNACTRANERRLGVNHWDSAPHDMTHLSVAVRGPYPLAFTGTYSAPVQAVDMRLYWSRLLEDFSTRGGRVEIRTLQADELAALAARHELLVVASGRAGLTALFPRVEQHSPYTAPQRLAIAMLVRGVAYSEPRALEYIATPGSGEVFCVPYQSFVSDTTDVTGLGVLAAANGKFEPLRHLRYDEEPRAFLATLLELLRQHAPSVFARVDPSQFDVTRPEDLGYAAITPVVRRAVIELANGRPAIAIGDAHVLMDPITGQGSNNASHAAAILAEAIAAGGPFDRAFCERVEAQMCAHSVPVSDACNARLQPPPPHVLELLVAAAHHQPVADLYAEGYNYPARFWDMLSSPDRTAAVLASAV